jgi:DNA-binding beta-propeller fold protein YncE
MRYGQGDYVYELDAAWGQLPAGWEFGDAVGVRVDNRDRVYVFNRGAHPIVVFDRDGTLVGSWGEGVFTTPHGLEIVDDVAYCVDAGDHTVRLFSLDGRLRRTIGTPGVPAATGWAGTYDDLPGGPPFCRPTNVAVGPGGDIYVSDGYANCRVHRFNADGVHLGSWGAAGRGPGQFRLPHGVCAAPDGSLLVGDRLNDRVQRFSASGAYLGEWSDVRHPDDVYRDRSGVYYVAELGYAEATPGDLGSRVTVRDADGRILSAWGDAGDPAAPGNFVAPHCVCTDSHGDLYLGEVTKSCRSWHPPSRGVLPPGTHVFQRFRRVR